jgi:hypothetical protein
VVGSVCLAFAKTATALRLLDLYISRSLRGKRWGIYKIDRRSQSMHMKSEYSRTLDRSITRGSRDGQIVARLKVVQSTRMSNFLPPSHPASLPAECILS